MRALVEGGEVIESLRDRILGRVTAIEVLHPETQETLLAAGTMLDEDIARRARSGRRRRSQGAHAADLRHALRPVRQVLRPRPRPRRPGQRRRGGRRDRRAVDRRAGHAADDAHLPHRWCGVACGGGLAASKPSRDGIIGFNADDALRDQRQGRAGGDLAFRRNHHLRPARPRARAPQGAVRRDAERQGRPADQGRHGAGQLGPADPPDHHRVRRHARSSRTSRKA